MKPKHPVISRSEFLRQDQSPPGCNLRGDMILYGIAQAVA
jgi:hypothetical protein